MSRFSVDSFLRLFSFILFLVFVIFSFTVVVRQIMLPDDILLRIMEENCDSVAVSSNSHLTEGFTVADYSSEDDFKASPYDCYLAYPDSNKDSFYSKIIAKKLFNNLDYLYISQGKGILIKKYSLDEKALVSKIGECFINNNCDYDKAFSSFSNLKVTWELLKPHGGLEIRETCSGSLSDIQNSCKKDFEELVSLKKVNKEKLILKVIVHRTEAFIDSKDRVFVTSLIADHLDGLILKSRGAVIALLPEDSIDRPFSHLDIKARKYGLKRNEYLNNMASLYLYTSRQYSFFNGTINEYYGAFSVKKPSYSNRIFVNANFAFLSFALEKKGSFYENVSMTSGAVLDRKKHLITQMLIGKNLSYYYHKTASGRELLDVFNKYAVKKVSSVRNSVMDALFISTFINISNNDEKTVSLLKELTSKLYFVDVEEFDKNNHRYAGLLGRAFLNIYEKSGEVKWLEKMERLYSGWKFPHQVDILSIREISYMIPVAYSLGGEKWNTFYSRFKVFIETNSKSIFYFNKAFYLKDYVLLEMETLMALELKKLFDRGFKDSYAEKFISEVRERIKLFTFLNEDIFYHSFDNRNFINGGVLPRTDAKAVNTLTTARSLNLSLD